jgi:hypothetical protein
VTEVGKSCVIFCQAVGFCLVQKARLEEKVGKSLQKIMDKIKIYYPFNLYTTHCNLLKHHSEILF